VANYIIISQPVSKAVEAKLRPTRGDALRVTKERFDLPVDVGDLADPDISGPDISDPHVRASR